MKTKYQKSQRALSRRKNLMDYYDAADTREFCIVCDTENHVRHLFRVHKNAEAHEAEIRKEYYQHYEKRVTDRFFFFVGLHRAVQFVDRLNMASYHISETEAELNKLF